MRESIFIILIIIRTLVGLSFRKREKYQHFLSRMHECISLSYDYDINISPELAFF